MSEQHISSFSEDDSGPSVEWKDGMINLSNAADPNGGTLRFTEEEWVAFLTGVRADEFSEEALVAHQKQLFPLDGIVSIEGEQTA